MPPGPSVALECRACGVSFERKAHRRVRGNVYCSRKCYYAGIPRVSAEAQTAKARATKQRWREDNQDRLKAYRREAGLRAQYGIGVEDYERMYAEQEGCCAICETHLPSLVVDHCHATQRVRGLLCTYCNVALGGFRDRAESAPRGGGLPGRPRGPEHMISRDCTCGATANGVPLPELLSEGWIVWHAKVAYLTCPECSATIARLERAVQRGTLIS